MGDENTVTGNGLSVSGPNIGGAGYGPFDPTGGGEDIGVVQTMGGFVTDLGCDPSTDPLCGGLGSTPSGGPVDSGDPCDPTSTAFDPASCGTAAAPSTDTGSQCFDLMGNPTDCGLGGSSGDVLGCTDSGTGVAVDCSTGLTYGGYVPSLDPSTVSWCLANPDQCNQYGPTTDSLTQFCNDIPAQCVSDSEGNTSVRGSSPGGTGGGAGGGIGGGSSSTPKAGSGTGTSPTSATSQIGQLLGGILKAFTGSLSTCPAGYIKNAAGQCVSGVGSNLLNTGGIFGGPSGTVAGIPFTTIIIIGVVLLIVTRKGGMENGRI